MIPILYEDDHVLAVNKPPRMASVPDPQTTLMESVLGKVQRQCEAKGYKPYLLHRLDAPTSGVLLFGKKPSEREALEAIFADEATEKTYLTFLRGVPKGHTLRMPLKARSSDAQVPAHTDFKVIATAPIYGKTCAFVLATIHTGRKHQIRQHFSMIHCPVVMDDQYGDKAFNKRFRIDTHLGRLFLHAKTLCFKHPFLHQKILIEASLAPDLLSVGKKVMGPKGVGILKG